MKILNFLPSFEASSISTLRSTQQPGYASSVKDTLHSLRTNEWLSKSKGDSFEAHYNSLQSTRNDKSESSLNRYTANELCRTILSLDKFRRHYQLEIAILNPTSSSLESTLSPDHLKLLQKTLRQNLLSSISTLDQSAANLIMGAATSSTWCALFDNNVKDNVLQSVENFSTKFGNANLTKDEILALTDYVDPDSNTFETVIQSLRLSEIGQPALRNTLGFFIDPLFSALDKLYSFPPFLHTPSNGSLFKGISDSAPGFKEVVLDGFRKAYEDKSKVRLGELTSTTSERAQSYDSREWYNSRFEFSGMTGVRVDCFHHYSTKSDKEVLLKMPKDGLYVSNIC